MDLTDPAGRPALRREHVLAELDALASVEHALLIEYLLIHAALGHDLLPADAGETADRVAAAAATASMLAQGQMRLLMRVNRGLTTAGRPAQVGRAVVIRAEATREVALVPASPAALDGFLDRGRRIAVAVDRRYARLRPAVDPEASLFDGPAFEQLSSSSTQGRTISPRSTTCARTWTAWRPTSTSG